MLSLSTRMSSPTAVLALFCASYVFASSVSRKLTHSDHLDFFHHKESHSNQSLSLTKEAELIANRKDQYGDISFGRSVLDKNKNSSSDNVKTTYHELLDQSISEFQNSFHNLEANNNDTKITAARSKTTNRRKSRIVPNEFKNVTTLNVSSIQTKNQVDRSSLLRHRRNRHSSHRFHIRHPPLQSKFDFSSNDGFLVNSNFHSLINKSNNQSDFSKTAQERNYFSSALSDLADSDNITESDDSGLTKQRQPHYEFAPFFLSDPYQNSQHSASQSTQNRLFEDPNYFPIFNTFPSINQRIQYLQPITTTPPLFHNLDVVPYLGIGNVVDFPFIAQHLHVEEPIETVQQPQVLEFVFHSPTSEKPLSLNWSSTTQAPNPRRWFATETNPIVKIYHALDEDTDESSLLKGVDDLRVGKSLNIFSRYGFLTLSIKVRPPVGEDNFLFLENTAEVFQRSSYWGQKEIRRGRGTYDDHFFIHFCENLNELLIAYFDRFTIDGLPRSHKAFTSSLSVRDLARQFGLNASLLNGHFSFVLVRLFRPKQRSTLQGSLEMQPSLKEALGEVKIGSVESVHQFVDRFGSHIITEFEVGDMMYQTFVFKERLFKELKNNLDSAKNEQHLEELQHHFTPTYATSVGSVQLASGNSKLEEVLKNRSDSSELHMYHSIFKIFNDPVLEAELEKLDGDAVLSLKLDKISSRLPRSPVTRWITEVLDNSLAMYYHHMASTRKNS